MVRVFGRIGCVTNPFGSLTCGLQMFGAVRDMNSSARGLRAHAICYSALTHSSSRMFKGSHPNNHGWGQLLFSRHSTPSPGPQDMELKSLSPLVRCFGTRQTVFLPEFERSNRYSRVTDDDIRVFRQLVSDSATQVLSQDDEVAPYCEDYMHSYIARDRCVVLLPSCITELQNLVKYCDSRKFAVVPQGGNTGLVGGSVPVFDEVVISMKKLNRILEFDSSTGVLICEAGCVLEELQRFLEEKQPPFLVPLDLGSKGSCTIGGNVSTNAGGLKMLRYGSLLGNVVGLEVVLSNGTILDSLSRWKKDNTGFKLHALFVGSEGSLGIVTKVAIQCVVRPPNVQLCLFQCARFGNILAAASQCRTHCNEIISALEFFDGQSLEFVKGSLSGVRDPFASSSPFYLLLETAGHNVTSDSERVEVLVSFLMKNNLVTDGVIAESDAQQLGIWKLRESISTAMTQQGKVYKYDLTLPQYQMYKLVDDTRARLRSRGLTVLRSGADSTSAVGGLGAGDAGKLLGVRDTAITATDIRHGKRSMDEVDAGADVACVGYGHLGDCNIHLNVLVLNDAKDAEIRDILEPWIYEYVCEISGSISSEHGMGLRKANLMPMCKNNDFIDIMRRMKLMLDPNRTLNPYKVLPL